MDKKNIGAKIRQFRITKGFSQEKLSEIVDISPRQMCLIENGNSVPSLETFVNIARVLEIDMNDFFSVNYENNDVERIEIIDLIKAVDRKKLSLVKALIDAAARYK